MGYVDSNLIPGETVVLSVKLHKIIFLWPGIFSGPLFIACLYFLFQEPYDVTLTGLCFISSVVIMLPTYLQYHNSEFAVTNKRIIAKTGYMHVRTIETLLLKVEAIEVNQDLGGRLLNYGTITIVGTGGTNESFRTITYPLEFRRAIQIQTDARGREWSIDQE